jgi:hypothetical protein
MANNEAFIRDFVEAFAARDVAALEPFLHPQIVFQNYGDG